MDKSLVRDEILGRQTQPYHCLKNDHASTNLVSFSRKRPVCPAFLVFLRGPLLLTAITRMHVTKVAAGVVDQRERQ
jgi:hypothetical protein